MHLFPFLNEMKDRGLYNFNYVCIVPIVTHRTSNDKIYGPSTMCVLTLAAAASVRFCVTLDARHKQKKRGGSRR